MSNFTLPQIDYATLGLSNYTYLRVTVEGFWSDCIGLTVQRNGDNWKVRVEHSAGGYESNFDQLTAEENFACATLAAIQMAREIESNSEILESVYQAEFAKNIAEREARLAEQEAKFNADLELGEKAAKELVDAMKNAPRGVTLNAYARGTNDHKQFFVTETGRFAYMLRRKQELISKAALIADLTQMSQRTCIHWKNN